MRAAKLSASFIVSRRPYIAAYIRHDVHALLFILFYLFFAFSFFLFARGVYVPLSVCLDATGAALANLCADELVPCGGHLGNQGYLMRPRGVEGAEEEGRMEGKLVEEFGGGGGGSGGVEKTGGKEKKKTMRQNQKINEALFQWQDLCTVNITLAIRGNPITLCLSSAFSL